MSASISRRGFLAGSSAFFACTSARSEDIFDLVVYGATSGGITAAVQAAKLNLRVVIVGGWRDRHLGGMMSGGLGGTDIDNSSSYGGLSRLVISKINALAGVEDNQFHFEPRFAEQVFDQLVAEHSIPVRFSHGIAKVKKEGSRITSLETVDGQTFSGKVFIDASYEGDLMALSGVSYTVGRESANERNPIDGSRGFAIDERGWNHNFFLPRRLDFIFPDMIDPFKVSGDAESGLLPGITDLVEEEGAGDKLVQAYNFRMTMTTEPSRRVDLPKVPDSGYDAQDYELLFRWLKRTDERETIAEMPEPAKLLLLHNKIGHGLYDINNWGPVSTDYIGGSWRYPEAGYVERERIWSSHQRWIRGLFYSLQHHNDSRVPEVVRMRLREYGLDGLHYLEPHFGDPLHWPYQLYVREARRMKADFVLDGADVSASDDSRPRSLKTASAGSYKRDSHHVRRVVKRESLIPGFERVGVWNEGNFEAPSGGQDQIFSIPYDVMTPKATECENLLVLFCISATHEAFGATRMEMTLMQLGQFAGAASVLAARSTTAVQDLPYGEIVGVMTTSDFGTAPILPA